MRGCLVLLLTTACGRIAFDPLDDGGGSGGSGSGMGSSDGGAMGDGMSATCPMVPMCPDSTITVDIGQTSTMAQVASNHGLSSTGCNSGGSNPERIIRLLPNDTANYTITVTPNTILYVQDLCCGGPELVCGASGIMVPRNQGQAFFLVVEGIMGNSYNLMITGS